MPKSFMEILNLTSGLIELDYKNNIVNAGRISDSLEIYLNIQHLNKEEIL